MAYRWLLYFHGKRSEILNAMARHVSVTESYFIGNHVENNCGKCLNQVGSRGTFDADFNRGEGHDFFKHKWP